LFSFNHRFYWFRANIVLHLGTKDNGLQKEQHEHAQGKRKNIVLHVLLNLIICKIVQIPQYLIRITL
jgi:hypothetical protein